MKFYYYPKTTKKVTKAFLDLFNDMTIYREDKDGNIVRTISPVPISFGPHEKMQAMGEVGHPSDETRYYQFVPKMAVIPTGITHAPNRAYSSTVERFWLDEELRLPQGESVYMDFQPTPYDFNFNLAIRCDSLDDLSQILENILPYFNPTVMMRVSEFSFINVERDLPVRMNGGPIFEFSDVMDSESMREVNANIDFTIEGWQYKPPTESAIVKIINSGLYVGSNAGYNLDGTPINTTDLHQFDSGQVIEGFYSTSAFPPSGYDTSGHNVDTGYYYTVTNT